MLRLLDAQVKRLGANDSKLLGAWKSAKRIGKGKVVPIEATIPAPVTTTPGQTPVTTTAATTPQAKAA